MSLPFPDPSPGQCGSSSGLLFPAQRGFVFPPELGHHFSLFLYRFPSHLMEHSLHNRTFRPCDCLPLASSFCCANSFHYAWGPKKGIAKNLGGCWWGIPCCAASGLCSLSVQGSHLVFPSQSYIGCTHLHLQIPGSCRWTRWLHHFSLFSVPFPGDCFGSPHGASSPMT